MNYPQAAQAGNAVAGSAQSPFASAQNAAPSRVASQQSLIDANINALHETVKVLEERLQPVLGLPAETAGNKNPSPIRPVAATVSQRMAESSDSLCSAINRIMGLVERLEI